MSAQQDYETLADDLARALPVTKSRTFGMPSLKTSRGKAFAGLYQEAMVFKLNEPERSAALSLQGAHLFDPGAMGRPMKEWVVVPHAHAAQWEDFAQAALAYVDKAS